VMRWITQSRFRRATGKNFGRFIFAFFNSIGHELRFRDGGYKSVHHPIADMVGTRRN
jgi:hypothetical protein